MKEIGSETAGERKKGVFPSALLILAVAFASTVAVVLFMFNPQTHHFYPLCVFHRMTGLLCPGCGGLRALHQLLHGEILTAFKLNPLVVISVPVLVAWQLQKWLSRRHSAGHSSFALTWGMFSVLVVFGIMRNFAFFKNYLAGL